MLNTNIVVLDARQKANAVQKIWLELYDESQDGFFLSWEWIGAWLATLPNRQSVKFICGYKGKVPQFVMVIGIARHFRYLFMKTGHLSTTGDYYLDDIVIENNGFLVRAGYKFSQTCIDQIIANLNIQSLIMPSLSSRSATLISEFVGEDSIHKGRICKTYYVDLTKVRHSKTGYVNLLSSNKRRQIKRSIKLYQQRGEINLLQARTIEKAKSYYLQMVDMHQKTWCSRGKLGAFSNKYLSSFHTYLIKTNYCSNNIRLYGFECGGEMIGFIYGFVGANSFVYYQSGFKYDPDNRLRPGLVCHTLLIEHLAAEDIDLYDFLAGESAYKKSMATDCYRVESFEWVSSSLVALLSYRIRKILQSLKRLASKLRK